MKIRIKDNSIRYRITQSEVSQLWREGKVEAHTAFSGGPLIYGIDTAEDGRPLSADFVEGRIVLHMPRLMIESLYHTDKIGFEDQTGPVRLLVEKDFACINHADEDQSDQYPHP